MPKDYVSLYQVIKEIAEEENAESDEGKQLVVDGKVIDQLRFQNYRKKRQAYMEEIFEKANLLERFKFVVSDKNDPSKKKEGFRIPISQKEYVKFLLRTYADSVSRKIRKNKIDKITTEEVKELIAKLTTLINKHVPKDERAKEMTMAHVMTQFQSRKAFDEVETGLLKLIGDDLGQVKLRPVSKGTQDAKVGKSGKILDKEVRIGNDSDAAFLIYYYYYLLQQQSKKWNKIVDTVAELRFEECAEMADYAGRNEEDLSGYHFRDIRNVVWKAQMRLFEQHMEDIEREENEPSPEQLRVVEELLKHRGEENG